MITIKAKYNERKEFTAIEKNTKKPCSLEALSIIVELYKMILQNDKEMTQTKINKIIKDALKEEE